MHIKSTPKYKVFCKVKWLKSNTNEYFYSPTKATKTITEGLQPSQTNTNIELKI